VDAWETTYLHVLAGDDAIVRWTSGTGLRPYLQALPSAEDREAFLAEYRALVGRAYPQRPWGTVLPFRRVFVVAQVGGGSA
jgi:trans-aconitate 2-methyltransferase